ncbi:MAG: HNH endonuclease [Verrucomicrobiota bacterium]|nr:HNH endonuclease [Verrucomicrobiota bacterium]
MLKKGDSSAETFLTTLALNNEVSSQSNLLYSNPINYSELYNFSLKQISSGFSLTDIFDRELEFRIKLRLAMHLSPVKAINYDTRSSISRVELVGNFLKEEFNFDNNEINLLSRVVATVLDSWDDSRKNVRTHLDYLIKRNGNNCAACKVPFTSERINAEETNYKTNEADHYKPYFDGDGVATFMQPEVDHIQPVSKFGINKKSNLQVLCRLCNQGKGHGTTLSPEIEYKYSCKEVSEIKASHRRKMLYTRLEMDKFSCVNCGTIKDELTIRKVRPSGAYVLSNLQSTCKNCAAPGS